MKIKDVQLSILRTELGETVIPTQGAVDKMPQLVLVSVSTARRHRWPLRQLSDSGEVGRACRRGREDDSRRPRHLRCRRIEPRDDKCPAALLESARSRGGRRLPVGYQRQSSRSTPVQIPWYPAGKDSGLCGSEFCPQAEDRHRRLARGSGRYPRRSACARKSSARVTGTARRLPVR